MSSDGTPEADALYNVHGIQTTDPVADKTVVEITCHPSMMAWFKRKVQVDWDWPKDIITPNGVRITPSDSLEPMHFLTTYASGRVVVGALIPDRPNRHARRSAAARA